MDQRHVRQLTKELGVTIQERQEICRILQEDDYAAPFPLKGSITYAQVLLLIHLIEDAGFRLDTALPVAISLIDEVDGSINPANLKRSCLRRLNSDKDLHVKIDQLYVSKDNSLGPFCDQLNIDKKWLEDAHQQTIDSEAKMDGNGDGNNPTPEEYDDDEEVLEEVIDLDDVDPNDDNIANEMGDMDLENYDEFEEFEEDEGGEMEGDGGEMPDDADACFTQHTGSVFSCDVDQTGTGLAVTGGEDDKGYIWNVTDGTKVAECTGHKDSVTCVSFSHDGTMVASGDMSGIVKVWKLDKMEEIWSFEGSDLEWLIWHHSAPVLLGGTADGDVWMWKVPSGDSKIMQGHGCQTTCGKIFADGKKCCVGYEDGVIKVWDLKQATALHTFKDNTGHSGGVTSLDLHEDNVLALTGSVDGTAKLLNTNSGKVLATFSAGPINSDIGETNSVEAVALCNSQPFAAVGSLNGALGIWDVPTQTLRHTCQHEVGIVRVKWDPSGASNVFTAGLDGCVRLWDARSGQMVSSWVGHRGEILDMSVTRDGSTIVTASGDTTARVYTVQRPER